MSLLTNVSSSSCIHILGPIDLFVYLSDCLPANPAPQNRIQWRDYSVRERQAGESARGGRVYGEVGLLIQDDIRIDYERDDNNIIFLWSSSVIRPIYNYLFFCPPTYPVSPDVFPINILHWSLMGL